MMSTPPLSDTIASILISFMSILEAPLLLSIVSRVNVSRMISSRIYTAFKDMSFFAYAGHKLICSVWVHIFAILMGGYWVGKFTALVAIFAVFGVATMMAVYYSGRRLFPRAMKILDGTL